MKNNTSTIPKYDLIIIDECESILKHFDSSTFNGTSRDIFNYMEAIIKKSKKVIFLDGDMSNRTYALVNSLGSSINIVNDIKINSKILKIINDENYYISKIYEDLDNNKNIVIVSMSANECVKYNLILKEKYPTKKILIYYGQSEDKEDLKDVLLHWKNADIIIYSPTIESGVNFDLVYFYKIYAIIVTGSTSQRSFLQMLSRVRKIENNEVLCLTSLNLNYSKYYQFTEVQDSLTRIEAIHLQNIYKEVDGDLVRILKLDNYDINYIYNKVEKLNQCSYGVLTYLQHLSKLKGYEFIMYEPEKINLMLPIFDSHSEVLSVSDISDKDYNNLLDKQ